MDLFALESVVEPADVDVGALWAASGAAWLTDRRAGAPGSLVRQVVGVSRFLDERGAGIADLVPAQGVGLLAERAAMLRFGPAGRVSCGGGTRLVHSSDRWMAVTLARDSDIELVPAWLEVDGDADGGLDPWSVVERTARERSAASLLERATLLGLPCSAMGETADDRAVLVARRGDVGPASIVGATVVNLASLWAGPLCGDLLARCGARLITVESIGRPDGARRRPAFFEALHGRSESVALDFGDDDDRVRLIELIERADVVIEGSRPRALEQLGVRAMQIRGPRVWLSITAHGRYAPMRIGFGDDTAVAGGLVATVAGAPRFVADAVADPLTGLVAAATVVQLVESGGRWLADIALARVARSMQSGWLPPVDGTVPTPPVPRNDPGAPLPLGRDNDRVVGR